MIDYKKGRHPASATYPVIAGVALLLVLAGSCSNGDRKTVLPSTSPPEAPTTSTATTSVEDAVRHAYTQYWMALPQAEQSSSNERRRQLLGEYATQPLLDDVLRNIDQLHARNLTSSGHIVVHIQKVQIGGNRATVWDCQDSTNAQVKNSRTGQVTSRGTPNDHLRATLARGSDGRWRINRISPLGRC
ncbi:hypothetical protein [Actinomadura miaoliensis]|uniref:Nuclear transport factor 2 family protein n=1 Tax=Actinomadura miaoliensis TaxID=430685 RepID=A0ABP7WZS7_9ACTN